MNTTFGLGGLFDPASRAGLDHNDEDFGQTFGAWGVPPGPFLELPLFGPSDLRDAPGLVADGYANPAKYVNPWPRYSYAFLSLVNKRVELFSTDQAVASAYDPYAFVRDAYLQNRRYKVLDGNVPDEPLEDPDAPAPDDIKAKTKN
jgi:phospholipid-binding lipoprotein MlaA